MKCPLVAGEERDGAVVVSCLTFVNLEQAEYAARVYLEEPEVLRADKDEVSGCWRVVVTRW